MMDGLEVQNLMRNREVLEAKLMEAMADVKKFCEELEIVEDKLAETGWTPGTHRVFLKTCWTIIGVSGSPWTRLGQLRVQE